MQTKTSITTLSGRWFDILHPDSYNYNIEEIAEALSRLCRYTGHTNGFYSVAEHSVLVSHAVPEKYALIGLLHDASEAFVGDVSSPLKALLPGYRDIENNIQQAIANHFFLSYPFPEEIHDADKRVYWLERKYVAPGVDKLWHQEYRASRSVPRPEGFLPEDAYHFFVERYKEIINDRDGQVFRKRETTAKAA